MKKIYVLLALIYCSLGFSQIVINEVDADTQGTDNLEFIELKSVLPNFAMDGYVLVFFNATTTGTGNLSYLAIDLDGYVTDDNGNILFGNTLVSPSPKKIIPDNTIQNGPDAIAIFLGNASDFPLGTVATNSNLIHALAYSSSNAITATTLMSVFGLAFSVNETLNSAAGTQSMQRKSDGTYEVKAPTPGVNNDGTGIIFNYVSTTPNFSTVNEGQNLIISFSTSQPVLTNPLVLNFTLNNGSFNNSDFTGNTTVTIPVGGNSGSTTIQILNDGLTEGDEELKIFLSNSNVNYSLNNNNIIARVTDANYIVSAWGTPLNPTYGLVNNEAPNGYYSSLEGLSGGALKQALQNIIANPAVVHAQNYGDIEAILKDADQNPANSSQVWLMYVEQPKSKLDYQTGSSNIGTWNREHIFPQSRGGFQDGTFSTPDGINVWLPTNADDLLAGHADAHHLRAEDGPENSTRSNRDYGSDYNGPSGSQGTWHGDVARSLFYMSVRYNALSLVNGNPPDTTLYQMGDLNSLLLWNHADPSDDFEMRRNNIIYNWQQNRNPFIDYPNLADYIFGNNVGQPWFSSLTTNNFEDLKITVYPNPAKDKLTISGITENSKIEIYSLTGMKILNLNCINDITIPLSFSSGIYSIKISTESKSAVKRLIIR